MFGNVCKSCIFLLWKKQRREFGATRCNLYNELNLFSTIFNWYKSEDEFEEESKSIFSPVRARYKQMAYIREPMRKPDDKK